MRLRLLFVCLICYCALSVTSNDIVADKSIRKAGNEILINYSIDLKGDTLFVPRGGRLIFSGGGHIDNGTVIGDKSGLQIKQDTPAFGLNVNICGDWRVRDIYDRWFEFDSDSTFVSNDIIKNILSLANDDYKNYIHLEEDRIYHFELRYTGRPDVWNAVSTRTERGKTVKNYDDVYYSESFSSFRIFIIPSNTHVTINNTLKMRPTDAGAYFVFWEYRKKNVSIDGEGSIIGDCKEHFYNRNKSGKYTYSGEWGIIFRCFGCRNFSFKDITISNAHGDAIGFGGSKIENDARNRISKGLVIDNVKIKYARRNGISLGSTNVLVKNCLFEGCGADEIYGTAPRSAIDFETNLVKYFPEVGNRNVRVKNCTFINNKHDISSTNNNLESFGRIATTVKNCRFTAPIRFNTTYWIEFRNCYIKSFTNRLDQISEDTPFGHIVFKNCTIESLPSVIKSESWHNRFVRCNIISEI